MTNLVELIGYVSKHGKPSECPNPRQGLFFVFRYDTIRYYTIRQILRADKNWRLNLPHGTKRKIKLKLEITCHDGKPDGMLRVERRRYGSAHDVSRGVSVPRFERPRRSFSSLLGAYVPRSPRSIHRWKRNEKRKLRLADCIHLLYLKRYNRCIKDILYLCVYWSGK